MRANTNRRGSAYETFQGFAALIGGGALLTTVMTGTLWPIAIAAIGLFCVLSFTNGLWSGK